MRRVQEDKEWSLFQPTVVPELNNTYGEEYERIYEQAEKEGKACATLPARKVWNTVLESQMESGGPYILFRDTINKHNNQVGLIRQTNLCCEVMETTNSEETAVCTLASVCLPKMVENGVFSFDKLRTIVDVVVRNLNNTIKRSTYPIHQAKYSHKKRRPIGLGVQGLSDTFQKLNLVFGSPEALKFDAKVFETIYLQACTTSNALAKRDGHYMTFSESPMAQGKFQFDLYDSKVELNYPEEWAELRKSVMEHGLRNSLLLALMPTASSAQIFGNSESFETRSSNAYVRRTLSGEFIVVNPIMYEGREWTPEMSENLLMNRGSVQNMSGFNEHEKQVFRTVFECSMKDHIMHASVRQPFIDQSQSMNLHFAQPTKSKLTSALFFAWKKQLKTGCYYLRRQTTNHTMGVATAAVKASTTAAKSEEKKEVNCDGDVCVMCSS